MLGHVRKRENGTKELEEAVGGWRLAVSQNGYDVIRPVIPANPGMTEHSGAI
ncbi:hypothetical protein HNQ60_000836 [Povalibacter uvarum]|uniref:Uncharacterized protein n=1 Tax=Povalibacter uvarum TaxID=732238 RepID=A0A841HI59_9GAMM|nr:hypothetical protein [Povalibacter uvarum]